MADVNQTRAELQRQLAATPYRTIDTPNGMRVEYEPIQDGFASDATHPTSRQFWGLNIDFRPRHSWAIVQRYESTTTRRQVSGALGAAQQVSEQFSTHPVSRNLVLPDDPQPVQAMVQLVSAIISQQGWKMESVAGGRTQPKMAVLGLIIGGVALLLLMVIAMILFLVGVVPG